MTQETEKKILVVCVKPNHPSGHRNRAGLTFTAQPTAFEVTEEQEAMIKEDQFLRIVERGTALDDAMANFKKESKENASEDNANDIPPATTAKNTETTGNEGKAGSATIPATTEKTIPPVETKNPVEKAAKPIGRMNKDELIAALEAKGQKAGTDFQADAKNDDLAALLQSL